MTRLDVWLAENGFANSRHKAQELISGKFVFVNGKNATKSHQGVGENDTVEVKEHRQYVSRAGEKLDNALKESGVSCEGKSCLDVGCSTGGFTECLLRYGAQKVVGIDVGHGQLHESLLRDPRVVLHEGVNAKDILAEEWEERFGMIVMDVSFISIKKILKPILGLAEDHCLLFALVKPQFEAGEGNIGKGGVVKDPEIRKKCVEDICGFVRMIEGWNIRRILEAFPQGSDGNQEYFLWAEKESEKF